MAKGGETLVANDCQGAGGDDGREFSTQHLLIDFRFFSFEPSCSLDTCHWQSCIIIIG